VTRPWNTTKRRTTGDQIAHDMGVFDAAYARSRHNADIPGCDMCQGRRACDYCGHRAVLIEPEQFIDQEAA
jgi:hypothetical protein